jgi:hypothetical protein
MAFAQVQVKICVYQRVYFNNIRVYYNNIRVYSNNIRVYYTLRFYFPYAVHIIGAIIYAYDIIYAYIINIYSK